MKIYLLIISVVLLIASLFGVFKSYNLPTERNVTQQVTLLDYQHQGKFSYLVSLKPSHLYGPEPPEPSPPLPDLMKYPIGIIDQFNMTFNYHFVPDKPVTGESAQVEVRATVKSSATTEQKEIILVPETLKTGDFTISFPLKFSDNITDNFLNISDNASGNQVTITAYVYATFDTEAGPVFESFTQNLPLRANGPLVEVEGELYHTSSGIIGDLNYEQQGEFSYEVQLRSSSSFGPITLKSPSITTPAPAPIKTLNSENTVMSRLIDRMDVSFLYNLEATRSISNVHETVEIDAMLENPEKWSKTFELIPLDNKSGNFTVTFPVDLNQYSKLFDTIQKETGGSASARNLTIKAIVHTLADTDYGPINSDFTQSISTDLTGETLAWTDNLTKSTPGSIKTTKVVPQVQKYLGMPVSKSRVLFAIAAGFIFIWFGFSLFWYFRTGQGKITAVDRKAQQAQKKYKNIIIEVKELPVIKPGETVIILESLDDLVRTAEGLLKPLLHKAEAQKHVYYVFDAETRYEYRLS